MPEWVKYKGKVMRAADFDKFMAEKGSKKEDPPKKRGRPRKTPVEDANED